MSHRGSSLGIGLLVAWASAAPCEAHALFSERYLVCQPERAEPSHRELQPPTSPKAKPLERRKRPAPLTSAPLVVADVSRADPIPSGRLAPEPEPEPQVVMREGSNDFRCLGLVRGRKGIARVVGAPPGARFLRHPHPESWIEQNMEAVGAFQLAENAPQLLHTLKRPVGSGLEPWQKMNRVRLKVAAASALADLGHTQATSAIRALAKEREQLDSPLLWEELVASLSRIHPGEARAYALEALARLAAVTAPGTRETNQLLTLLPLFDQRSDQAVKLLTQVHQRVDPQGSGNGFVSCRLFAARIRSGDDKLKSELRGELSVDLRTNRASVCFSEAMAAAFPGDDPAEVDALLFRHRYEELLRFVAKTRDQSQDQVISQAHAKIRTWLAGRAGAPDVALDTSDRRFHPDTRARHLALAAALGDKSSDKALRELISDPKDDGTAPWVAAAAALDLGLAGATDLAFKRLLWAREHNTTRHSSRSWAKRGSVHVTEHVELVDRLADRGDPRFVVGLLDRDPFVREAAVHLLAAKRPQGACALVVGHADLAEPRAIQDALWALTILGESCRGEIASAWAKPSARPELRGMALEALAMLRDARYAREASPRSPDPLKPARERAQIIFASPE